MGEPELSGKVVVRSDGRITLRLVNPVRAAGLTFKELQALLEAKFKSYLAVPRVTVSAAQGSALPPIDVGSDNDQHWLLPDLWPVR
jgi:protein involved in polysaccharide export with SLBB domain